MKFLKEWEKIRKRGLFLYLTRYELFIILGWFIGSSLNVIYHEKNLLALTSILSIFKQNFIQLIILLVIGLIVSYLGWDSNEKRYKELQN